MPILGIVLAVAGIIAVVVMLTRKPEPEPEPPIPPEPPVPPMGEGRLQGYVISATTGVKLPQGVISVDGEYNTTGYLDGSYRTLYIPFGIHTFMVAASDHQTTSFDIDLEILLQQHDFKLPAILPVDGWPADVEVTEVVAQPPLAIIGKPVNIGVYFLIPYPTPVPDTVTGTVSIDGEQFTRTVETRGIRNAGLWLAYTPTMPGTYTAKAKNRSVNFTVIADASGVFYSPFGCVYAVERSQGYWTTKSTFVDSIIRHGRGPGLPATPPDYRDCYISTHFSAGYGEMAVSCPYCKKAIIGVYHDYIGVVGSLLSHIKDEHPELPLDKPPAWLRLADGTFKTAVSVNGKPATRIQLNPYIYIAAVSPGVSSIHTYDSRTGLTTDFTVDVPGWGDRIDCDLNTQMVTSRQSWGELSGFDVVGSVAAYLGGV